MSAPQSVLDALADAETLHRYLIGTSWDLLFAEQHGRTAIGRAHQGNELAALRHAEIAARAAFRAVPGLRGDV